MTGRLHGTAYSCPACSSKLDGYTTLGNQAEPNPGSLSLCLYCSALLEFAENGLIPLTLEKLDALPADLRNKLLRAAYAVGRARELSGKPPKPIAEEFHRLAFPRRKP